MVISDPTFSKKMMNPDIKEIEAVTLHIPAHPYVVCVTFTLAVTQTQW